MLSVNPSSLSRYESEQLGAPTSVINYCLAKLAMEMGHSEAGSATLGQALGRARLLVQDLQQLNRNA